MPTTSILVSDQDRLARTEASTELRRMGYSVSDVSDLDSTLSELNNAAFDLLMLDMTADRTRALKMLRDLKSSRRVAPVRVLMTSGRCRDAARVLRSGADDFLPKPYALDELMARIDLSLQRNPILGPSNSRIKAGRLSIDHAYFQVTVDEAPLKIPPREYQLLRFFAGNPGRVHSREQLLACVWRQAHEVGARTVDVYVRRLRRLLEPHRCDHYVATVRGVGYRFCAEGVTKMSRQ
ncbi:MAG: winged helix-turn-helix domain-containing protein [Gammaproteobacteria bacterium]